MENIRKKLEEKVALRKIILESNREDEDHEYSWGSLPSVSKPHFKENGETIYFPKR